MNFFSIVEAVVSGVVSIPVDIYYGARRTAEDAGLMGRDIRLENAAERDRLMALIGSVINGDRTALTRVVEIILENFFDKVPDSVLRSMAAAAGMQALNFAVRTATKTFLVNLISTQIINRAITRAAIQRAAKFGVGAVLTAALLQGLLERASNAAQNLRQTNPQIYQHLRNANLDMLYFLVEEHVEPYLAAARMADTNPAEFQRLLREIETRLRQR